MQKKWHRFFARCYLTAFRFGSSLAVLRFMLGAQLPVRQMIKATRDVNIHREQSREHSISSTDATDFLVKQELLPVTNYLPDGEMIKKNGIRVFMAVGTWALGKKTWYAQASQILAEQLGCELVTFPGHHGSFLDMPDEFAATLRGVFHKVEAGNR